ncbi:MAG: tol-pal system protein YbgF [Acidobacteriota bacterium]
MSLLRGTILVLLLAGGGLAAVDAAAATRARPRRQAAAARSAHAAYVAEQARANRLAELLVQEEIQRRHTAGRPAAGPHRTGARPVANMVPAPRQALPAGGDGSTDPTGRPASGPVDAGLAALFDTPSATRPADPAPVAIPRPAPLFVAREGAVSGDVGGVRSPRRATRAVVQEPGARGAGATGPDVPGAAGRSRAMTREAGAAAPASDAAAGPAADIELFHAAYSDLSRGDTGAAREEFTRFRDTHPGHDLADNAQYWIGECYAAEGRFEEALEAYRMVIDHFPFGDKAAEALLKSGYVLLELGREDEARPVLSQVVDDFPGTGPARRAAARLQHLPAR